MDIARYYQSTDYISHSDTKKGLINRLYHLVRRYTLHTKRKLIERRTGIKKGTLLDIGAGSGAFMNHMRLEGWKVTGIEQDQQASANAKSLYDLTLHGLDGFFNLPAASFNAITMWHVLEHVHDLHEYIEQIKKLLAPAGKIFIAVPNYTSYDAGKYGKFWAAYDVPRHLYHFSPAAMAVLLESHGMKIDHIQPMWFDSFYVSLLSEKYRSGHPNLFRGVYNGLLSNSQAISNGRRASSIIYIIS